MSISNKFIDFSEIMRTINSCTQSHQLVVCDRMITCYGRKYPDHITLTNRLRKHLEGIRRDPVGGKSF